jgi:DNA-binding NtrC family response regulator
MTMRRILVVDDEEDELVLYGHFLKAPEYDIVTIASSGEALDLLRRERWDVLITDIYMPEHDGFEVMKTGIRHNPELRCIAVTGYGTENVLREVLERNCFGYVNKPFDWNYLKLLVGKALRPNRQTASARKWRRKPGET